VRAPVAFSLLYMNRRGNKEKREEWGKGAGAKWKEGWVYSNWPDRQHQAPPHLKLSLFSTCRGKILEKVPQMDKWQKMMNTIKTDVILTWT
jgi:hypothetical protein